MKNRTKTAACVLAAMLVFSGSALAHGGKHHGSHSQTHKTHHYQEISVSYPDCENSGWRVRACTQCGQKEKTQTGAAHGHHYGAWCIQTEATDCSAGMRTGICGDCGKTRTECYYLEGTLYCGISDKESVCRLQQQLTDLGFPCGAIDGLYGAKTEQAVREFQKFAALEQTGIAYPATQQVLALHCGAHPAACFAAEDGEAHCGNHREDCPNHEYWEQHAVCGK